MNQKNFLEMKMPDLEVLIFSQKIKLSYQENEKQKLLDAVETLNKNWNKFSDLHGKVSDLKIIALISLELQDSIGDMQGLKEKVNQSNIRVEKLKKEIIINNNDLKNKLEKIKKLEFELSKNKKEMFDTENLLDNFHEDLLDIKNKLLKNYNE